jgi:hypothetical protein
MEKRLITNFRCYLLCCYAAFSCRINLFPSSKVVGGALRAFIEKTLCLVSGLEMKKPSNLDRCRYFIHKFYLRVL